MNEVAPMCLQGGERGGEKRARTGWDGGAGEGEVG